MLYCGHKPLRGAARDDRTRHLARYHGILGEILEVPARHRVAVDIHAGRIPDIRAHILGLFADSLAHLLGERAVPGAGDSRLTGICRAAVGVEQAVPALDAGGAVVIHRVRDAEALNAVGLVAAVDNEHGHFVKRELVEKCVPKALILINVAKGYRFVIFNARLRRLALGHGVGKLVGILDRFACGQGSELRIGAIRVAA